MPLFRVKGRTVVRIPPKERRIKEEVIHQLIEDNISRFFEDLVFVARKPRIGGKESSRPGRPGRKRAPLQMFHYGTIRAKRSLVVTETQVAR